MIMIRPGAAFICEQGWRQRGWQGGCSLLVGKKNFVSVEEFSTECIERYPLFSYLAPLSRNPAPRRVNPGVTPVCERGFLRFIQDISKLIMFAGLSLWRGGGVILPPEKGSVGKS